MSEFESKCFEHLQSLADAARKHWDWDGHEDYFETELVRAEEFIAKNENSQLLDG